MKKILLMSLLTVLSTSLFAQADLQPAAIVNLIRSEPITVRQFRTDVQRMETAAGRSLTKDEKMQVLDAIINERLCLQAAERDRVIVTENEVNTQIQQLRTMMAQQIGRQPTDAEFAQAVMSETGLDINSYREQLRKQVIVQKYLMSKKGDLINSVKAPTEAEIISEYNLLKTNLVRPQTVRISMIQVPYGSNRTQSRDIANRLIREIGNDPSKFDEVSARSVAPNSGYQAGDAGFLPMNAQAREVVGQAILDAAFALNQGQISSLVEGPLGFNILKVTESYTQKNLELDDIFQLGTRLTVREYIGQSLLNQRQQAALAQATQELVTELRSGKSFQVFEKNINW